MNPDSAKSWKAYLRHAHNRKEFIFLVLLVIGVLYGITCFLSWNENRPGQVIDDVLLSAIPARDLSIFIGLLTNGLIFGGLVVLVLQPGTFRLTLLSLAIICSLRMFAMYIFPLDPPIGIIPLRDLMLENTFYSNKVMVRDLFFSGHTSNIFLVGLLLENKVFKKIVFVGCFLVGCMVIIQHVHYTIDVVVAPFAAYLSFFIARTILGYRTRALI